MAIPWLRISSRNTPDHTLIPAIATPWAYLIGPGKLHVDNARLAYTSAEGRQVSFNAEELEMVVAYGQVTPSSHALALMAENSIDFALLSANGQRFVARLDTDSSSRVLARVLQFRVLHDPQNVRRLAAQTVADKIHSQIGAARHYQRQGRRVDGALLERLARFKADCTADKPLESLRGIEGAATAAWFEQLGLLLNPAWKFQRRIKRPPTDPVNALLSLGYTLLVNRASALLLGAGLEPALGSLHQYRAGRKSLSCDLIESLRVPAVDRWVIRVCNQQRVKPSQFVPDPHRGGLKIDDSRFGRVLADWHQHYHDQQLDHTLRGLVFQYLRQLRELGRSFDKNGRALERSLEHDE